MEYMETMPEVERPLDQIVTSFRDLVLNGAENQKPALPMSTEHRIGGDMYDVLAMPWRHRVPTAKDCDTTMNHYNLTMETMDNTHKDHIRRAEQMRSQNNSNTAGITLVGFVGTIPAIPTSFQEYIFNCSMCYDMFALLYVNIYSPSEAPKPSPESTCNGPNDARALKRRNSSSIMNLPSISFDGTKTTFSFDLITPSTSTFFSFYEAAHQHLTKKVKPESNTGPIRMKKFSRNRKDFVGYQRPQRQ